MYQKLVLQSAFAEDKKLVEQYAIFNQLIDELKQKHLSPSAIDFINHEIEQQNSNLANRNTLLRDYRKMQSKILKMLEKDFQLVTKNHYRTMWMVLGMAAFGLPIGLVFGNALKNMGLMGIGLPIGMGVGILVGSLKDKKAFEQGKQLNVDIKY